MLQMVALATAYGRYGYRRITALLRQAGWRVNAKRIERLWRQEGLKVPARQPKRGRLWLTAGSCVRLRPAAPNHVWAYDFVHERTHDGQALRLLTVVDEYTRECLAIRVARRLRSDDVLQQLTELFVVRGTPAYLRSDNGPELTASAVREWLARVRAHDPLHRAGESLWGLTGGHRHLRTFTAAATTVGEAGAEGAGGSQVKLGDVRRGDVFDAAYTGGSR